MDRGRCAVGGFRAADGSARRSRWTGEAAWALAGVLAAGCAMVLREAVCQTGYRWQQHGACLPEALLSIFQETGMPIDDEGTGRSFRELDLLAALDHVMAATTTPSSPPEGRLPP